MKNKQPDITRFITQIDLKIPLIGLYDAPDPAPFAPLITPQPGECVFKFYPDWLTGKTLHLTADHFGCGGCGRWLFNQEPGSREDFLSFLVDEEGLKASRELMSDWINKSQPYQKTHAHILIGPLKADVWEFVKSISFFVNPDQVAAMVYGTNFHSSPDDPPPLISPFGSGCMELIPYQNLEIPQAALGATDIAMRQYLPAEVLTISVTKPMFERLCSLDEKSFLYKPFLQNLKKSRGFS